MYALSKRLQILLLAFSLTVAAGASATAVAAPAIDSLSSASQARSGYLEIIGAGFGNDGEVWIGGHNAAVATWTESRVVAYVPEAAALGPATVEVWNADGVSNTAILDVTERLADGRVKWRLRMDAPYSLVRPAVAADGTIYAVDVRGRLYALSPDGALKWLVLDAGGKGVTLGADGTIYTGSESAIKAFNSDGSEKWTFVQDPRAFILIGIAVGPDGNIYGVASSGMGVFSLDPDGFERWRTSEAYDRPIVVYSEIVFGPGDRDDQLYFYANRHLRAVELKDGASVFEISGHHPVVSPLDGSVHFTAAAVDPDGLELWRFTFPVQGVPVTMPDVAPDGVHYVGYRGNELYAIDPDGRERWHLVLDDRIGRPIVDPLNSQVVVGNAETLNFPGVILAVDLGRRKLAWRLILPPEETDVFNPWTGLYGFNQYIAAPARFSPDGQVAYVNTAIADGGLVAQRAFLYAVDAASSTSGGGGKGGGDKGGGGGGKGGGGKGKPK